MLATAFEYALLIAPRWALAAVKIENPLGANSDFTTVIVRIADFLAAIAIPLTTLMVIYAAYLYLTGGANPDQIKRAHKAIIWAIVGFIVVLVAKGLSELIQNVIGVRVK
ncbi:MAG: TrbC/VirB2 family protein [bacterium]|nr:TrbC/VirB2 family protein [bacterium]